MGHDFHTAFLYSAGGQDVDKGVSYAAEDPLSDDHFLKAIYLELKTDNTEEVKQKSLAFGVKKLDVPNVHLYFQALGGQVFRLVGINEDLSLYEGSPSSKPGSSTSAS